MPVFRFNKAVGVGRGVKAFLNFEGGLTRGVVSGKDRRREQAAKLKAARKQIEKQRRMLENKERKIEDRERKIERLRMLLSATDRSTSSDLGRRTALQVEEEPGALPDFVIIGAQKGGTSFLYRLLTQHPHVEPAVVKEVHYFDLFFNEGVRWYRCNFPAQEKRHTITGEASPYYLYHPHAARRAAEVIPQAKMIVLLRNPVDRAYSNYHHQARIGHETLSFAEAIEAEQDRLRGEVEKMLEDESYISLAHRRFSYLSRGVYVDQIREWHKFFDRDQIFVLKSEDFFEHTPGTLKSVLNFLQLPAWEPSLPKLSKPRKKEGRYPPMDLADRQRLQDYFEPHNRRLYEYLGTNFDW